MNAKLSKLISKYVKVIGYKDLRVHGAKDRPDYVMRQKLKKMNWKERAKFTDSMRRELDYYEQ